MSAFDHCFGVFEIEIQFQFVLPHCVYAAP